MIFVTVRYAHSMYESRPPTPQSATAKHRMFFSLVLSVFLIIGIGCFIWWQASDAVIKRRESTPPVNTSTPTAIQLDAATIVTTLQAKTPGTKLDITSQSDGSKAYTDDRTEVYTTIPRQPEGYSFLILPSQSFGFQTTGDRALADTALDMVRSFFDSNGFRLISEQIGDKTDTTHVTIVYESDRTSCLVSEQTITRSSVSVGCADVSAYQQSATRFTPAYELLPDDVATDRVAFGVPQIKAGADRYKQLQISMNGWRINRYENSSSTALFYQLPNGSWRYFKNTRSLLACNEFDSSELIRAFSGERCLGPDGQVTRLSE